MRKECGPFRAQISICTWRGIDVPTIRAVNRTLRSKNPQFDYMFGTGDALISRIRSTQATRFLHNPSMGDVLLFIDTDIVFEPHQAVELATLCYQGYPVIGGLYVTRHPDQPKATIRLKPGTEVDVSGSAEPLEVTFASTGFFAIHRKVLEDMAQTMPLCHPGDRAEMYPFFMPMTYDKEGTWEYLSEDWAFCERARDHGHKTYIASSVLVGHLGERIYWVNDLFQKTSDTTYAVVTEGLSHNSEMINDLAVFRGADPRDIAESLSERNTMQELVDEWTKAGPTTAKEVGNFWANSEHALDALAMHRISEGFRARLQPAIDIAHLSEGPILDIGGGLGDFSIAAKHDERNPIYLEQEGQIRNFAISRLRRRRMNLPVIASIDQLRTPDGQRLLAEAAVAIDSLNICHPETANLLVKQAFDCLAPGGDMYVGSCQMEGWPFCLTSDSQIEKMMTDAGFLGGPAMWHKPK